MTGTERGGNSQSEEQQDKPPHSCCYDGTEEKAIQERTETLSNRLATIGRHVKETTKGDVSAKASHGSQQAVCGGWLGG